MTSKEIQDKILNWRHEPAEFSPEDAVVAINLIEGLNKRLDLFESRISTVQDDILRVERSVQTLADDTSRMIAGPLPEAEEPTIAQRLPISLKDSQK